MHKYEIISSPYAYDVKYLQDKLSSITDDHIRIAHHTNDVALIRHSFNLHSVPSEDLPFTGP